MHIGSGDLQFELVTGWQRRPSGWPLEDIAGVCTDVDDNVYLYARGDHPVSTYSEDGSFLGTWSEGQFSPRSHGAFMSRHGDLYLVDDGLGRVGRYSLDGKLLATIGPVGVFSDTGHQAGVEDSVARGGPPYNRPTNLSVGPMVTSTYRTGTVTLECTVSTRPACSCSHGVSPVPAPASSVPRTGSPFTATGACSSPTVRTTGYRCSALMATTWRSGLTCNGRKTYS